MDKNRIVVEFSKCCKSTVSRNSKLDVFEPYCDKCNNKCKIADLEARILVDGNRKDKHFVVTSMMPYRKIINVLIVGEDETPFQISYLEHECELIER